jgi:hypothetical protein
LKRDTESAKTPAATTASVGPEKRSEIRGIVIALVVMVLVVLAVGSYFYFHRKPKLTDKDTIVLADFDNKTGDRVFDDTLKTALSVALRQSPFLNLLSDDRVGATLKLMTRPANTALTPEVTREAVPTAKRISLARLQL